MSLGQPDLYIAGRRMQTLADDPLPALAGLKLKWGGDSHYELDPAATLSGQLLVRGAPPEYLNVGAPVGLVDPATSRTLFAGTLEPLRAVPEERLKGSTRISWTAAGPRAELEKHRVLDFDWANNETADARRGRLAAAMPRGWTLDGVAGWNWIGQGRQKYQSVEWLTLAERYARSYLQRLHDTSTYIPGAGLRKRITITNERAKNPALPDVPPGEAGRWQALAGTSGIAVLPASAVASEIEWEKTPDDVITDVQVTTWGRAVLDDNADSQEFEYWMAVYVNNTALQDAYGYRQQRVETSLSSYNATAAAEAIRGISGHWLNTATDWRPTSLQLPDSRRLDTAVLLNLLAVDSRHMAAVRVPGAMHAGLSLAEIRAYVLGGEAEWDGKKWLTTLTLGRKL